MKLNLSNRPLLIGVVHLRPLPGAPGACAAPGAGSVAAAALADARAYADGGCDAIILENFGDMPFAAGAVGPETVAGMAAVARRVRNEVSLPMGFNVLRNDAMAALGLCAACGGGFIRVNVHSGAMLTDQGLLQGDAFGTVRKRDALCPGVMILADVLVKHAVPVTPVEAGAAAHDTFVRGKADGLILSGSQTGREVEQKELEEVRKACPEAPLFIGSGVSEANAGRLLEFADGLIVASSLKRDGIVDNPVDVERVRRLVGVVRG